MEHFSNLCVNLSAVSAEFYLPAPTELWTGYCRNVSSFVTLFTLSLTCGHLLFILRREWLNVASFVGKVYL